MIHDFLSLPTFVMCAFAMLLSTGLSVLALIAIRKKVMGILFIHNHVRSGAIFQNTISIKVEIGTYRVM